MQGFLGSADTTQHEQYDKLRSATKSREEMSRLAKNVMQEKENLQAQCEHYFVVVEDLQKKLKETETMN